MKRLFLQVYALIMGSMLAALVAMNYLNDAFYEREIEGEYLKKASMLTQAIRRDLERGADEKQTLAWWRAQLLDNEMDLEMVPLERPLSQAHVNKLSVTEAEDQLEVVVPFDAARALKFSVDDRAEPGAMWAFYGGYAFLYLLLAALIYALTIRLYRHIDQIRRHAQRVAEGDYTPSLPAPSNPAFGELHADLDRMTRALAEKTQENHLLTAAIHHELRTPLTRLRLALDMALVSARTDEVPELLGEMDGALGDLSQLMDDLLTLSRLRLAHQPPPREEVALDQLLEQCAARLSDERISLALTPGRLLANRPLLERALSNLIENACKYARERIAITLTVTEHEVVLDISDDGPGIPEEAREWVRQPFFRVDQHRNRSTGGFGLGLAIADLALKESGAQWTIGSSQWGGASFRLRWQRQDDIK